ncbi:MAG: glycerol-3-phosphate dehydrogenase/oxidase [Phycisphaerae bacterium]|nr:glycerol-3-phosphate dehydrogenase/oxidase [Phycisphaerae bacterium]
MKRPQLKELASGQFDLLVIGGGITGAAVARDAALRGLSVLLVEKDDFASGTSSKSSKLVHGGLRYLEHGDLRLVMEGCRERRYLLRNAGHLVHPLQFLIPVFKDDQRKPWQWRAGLWLYDVLAAFRNVARHRILKPDELRQIEPNLPADDIVLGGMYYDAAMQDARLCVDTIRSAASAGARCANYAEVVALRRDQSGRLVGARVGDILSGIEQDVSARTIINATGPWADKCARLSDQATAPRLRLSKGVHLVTRNFTGSHAILSTGRIDGRIFVIVPWLDFTLIGTTDTDYDGSPDDVAATPDDVAYLLGAARTIVPGANLTEADVITTMAGVRPLLDEPGKAPSDLSRTHSLVTDAGGLISVIGGKYTTHRAMAAETVDLVVKRLARQNGLAPRRAAGTAHEPLSACDVEDFPGFAADALCRLRDSLGLSVEAAKHLVATYGLNADRVVEPCKGEPWLAEPLGPDTPHIRAEALWAFEHEMAYDAADFFFRRTSIGYGRQPLDEGADSYLDRLATALDRCGLDAARDREAFARRCVVERRRAVAGLGRE